MIGIGASSSSVYQGPQPNMNGNLGPPIVNGVRPPLSYSGPNYSTPAPNMAYSSPGVPNQQTQQNFMPLQPPAVATSMPGGAPPPQQSYNSGYQNYPPAQAQMPPATGMQHPQQVLYLM